MKQIQQPGNLDSQNMSLAFSYSEHLGLTRWTDALCRRLAVLHGYRLWVPHFSFGSAFNAIRLHDSTSFLTKGGIKNRLFSKHSQTESTVINRLQKCG